jgi:hypothetical protein
MAVVIKMPAFETFGKVNGYTKASMKCCVLVECKQPDRVLRMH